MKKIDTTCKEDIRRSKLIVLITLLAMMIPVLFVAECVRRYSSFIFHLWLLTTGCIYWTGCEYYFHRFIMHDSNQRKGVARLLNHSHHHSDPPDIRVTTPHRLFMITGSGILVALSIWFNNYFTLFCGYFVGFTIFCLMHVVLHHSWSKKIFPHLHQFHIHHHCGHPDKCFGVTLTWWDHLFGTMPDRERKISDRILRFYYKKEKKFFFLHNRLDEKTQLTDKQTA